MKISKTSVFFLFLAILVGASSWVTFTAMKKKNHSRIVFHIPDNFKGLIRVAENENDGAQPSFDSEGRLSIHIPDSGMLELKSLDLFFSPFEATALYDGELLRVAPISDHLDGTVMWVLNQPMKREIYFYLGDRDNSIEFLNKNRRDLYAVD